MLYDPKKYMASFLQQHYKGHSVQIVEGCCRKCLKNGKPSIYSLTTHPWSSLLDTTIDPYQAAGVFHPGSQFHSSHFKKPLLNLRAPALPCKYPATCELTCLLCNRYIDGPGIEMPQWPGFRVHAQCTSRCQNTNCQTRLPDFPAYINYERSLLVCEEHQLTKGFQRMAIGAYVAPLLSEAKSEIRKAPAPSKPVSLVRLTRTDSIHREKPDSPWPAGNLPKSVGLALAGAGPATPPKPDLKPTPKHDNPPAVRKTVTFKRPPGKARADRFNGDRSRCIMDYFASPDKLHTVPEAPLPQSLTPPDEVQPRRFLKNKHGEVYAYWKGEYAHCIESDAVLFKSSLSGRKLRAPVGKLDFTPPRRLSDLN